MIGLDREDIPLVGEIGVLGFGADLLLNGGDIIVSALIAPLLTNFSLVAAVIGQLDSVAGSIPWLGTLSQITVYALLIIYALRLINRLTGNSSST